MLFRSKQPRAQKGGRVLDLVINFAAIWSGIVTSAVLGAIAAAAAFVWRLWRMPDTARETLEELRLLRAVMEQMSSAQDREMHARTRSRQ